uniref:Microtubule-associated protein 70-2-like n=1 Tax=Tanacetum cinerariifolium TaxID=118510 RepID=A0A6L2LZ54_TANCI|nr:microtubule-associated protein 70-2-like [Tanacetum cinerariifolium]
MQLHSLVCEPNKTLTTANLVAKASSSKTVTVIIDSDEFKDLLQDSVKVKLERLEYEVRDKDQKFSKAQAKIKKLWLSQQLMKKDIEQLTTVYSKLEKELKMTDSLLQCKGHYFHLIYFCHQSDLPILLRVMSSPNHHTSNIEDAFSSSFPDYILASSDYVPALPGNTYSISSNNSFGLVLIASPTLSLFHDDPYMKVMHAYYAKESPIPPPVIMPPSPMLSPLFNPQEFFLPEELLPPKKRRRDRSSFSTPTPP